MFKYSFLKLSVAIMFFISLISCSSGIKIISEDYYQQDLTSKLLTIMPVLQNNIHLSVMSEMVELLESDSTFIYESIQDSVAKIIYERLDHYMSRAILDEQIYPSDVNLMLSDRTLYNQIELFLPEMKIWDTFDYPKKEIASIISEFPEKIFYINMISIGKIKPQNTVFSNSSKGSVIVVGDSEDLLKISAKYIIWDYEQNQAVSYGIIDSYAIIEAGLNPNLFIFAVQHLTDQIFKDTPFDYSYNLPKLGD